MSKYLRFDANLHMRDMINHIAREMQCDSASTLDEEGNVSDYDMEYATERIELADHITAVELMHVTFTAPEGRRFAVSFMPYEGKGWESIMDFCDQPKLNAALASFCDPLEG